MGGGPRPEALPAVLWQEHPSSQMEPRGCPPKLFQKGLLLGIPELPPGSSSASLASSARCSVAYFPSDSRHCHLGLVSSRFGTTQHIRDCASPQSQAMFRG